MARIRIGFLPLGTINKHKNQSIYTNFFMLGLPLFPTKSIFTGNDGKETEIKLNSKSVLLGYTRFYLSVLVGFGIFLSYLGSLHSILNISNVVIPYIILLIMITALVLSFVIAGKIPKDEADKGAILSKVVGNGCLPHYLKDNTHRWILSNIEKIIKENNLPADLESYAHISTHEDKIEHIFSYASYMAVKEAAWIDVEKRAWDIIQNRIL